MVFVAHEELVVRDFVRFVAPFPAGAQSKGRRRSTPSCYRPQNEKLLKVQAVQEPQPRHASKQLLTAPWLQTQEQPKTCPDHVLSGGARRWLHPGHDQTPIWVLLPSRLARCNESGRWRIE